MKQQLNQEDYKKKVDKVRRLVLEAIKRHFGEGKRRSKNSPAAWSSAIFRIVWFGEGNNDGWKTKLRITQTDGNVVGIQSNYEINDCIRHIGHIKDAIFFDNKWYGLILTVYPNGKHEVELDHDPNCCNDPHWYES